MRRFTCCTGPHSHHHIAPEISALNLVRCGPRAVASCVAHSSLVRAMADVASMTVIMEDVICQSVCTSLRDRLVDV